VAGGARVRARGSRRIHGSPLGNRTGVLAKYAEDAYASAKEVENDLTKARDLGLPPRTQCEDLLRHADEVSRLCFSLSRVPPLNPRQTEILS